MVPLLLTLDGDLADWTEPPRWMITAQSQVAGPERVANDQDLSARLWARLDAAGLWVAGDVRDDVVRLPAYATDIAADHPEIWLALPAPAMPPIGWANQFGEQTLTSAADCGQADLGSEPSECESWFAGQGPWRANLARMFVRQYVLTPQVTELYASSGDPKVPALPCCRASEAVVVPIDGGYRFEAHIGLADLPATLGDRITEARILVDIVDVDGPPRDPPVQESFLSITRKRRFADSSTFEVLRPVEPIRLPAPPFAARLLAPEARLARFPGQPDLGWTFENVPMGYQYEPSEPSPSPVVFDLKPRLLGRHAGFDLALAPIGGELSSVQELWVLRAGAVVAHAPLDVSHLERAGLVDGHPASCSATRPRSARSAPAPAARASSSRCAWSTCSPTAPCAWPRPATWRRSTAGASRRSPGAASRSPPTCARSSGRARPTRSRRGRCPTAGPRRRQAARGRSEAHSAPV
ncbi:MAG TPA: hypothetical protein PKA64_06800 [Myxococcota bacterium]|nr:hypothetical protein [Myxococcota bacterium]